jgi:hypothetical protein
MSQSVGRNHWEEDGQMVLLDDKTYRKTKDIALGRCKKSPLLVEFSDWFARIYSVQVLNIEFSKINREKNRYRLHVIIGNTDDYRKMYKSAFEPNEEYQRQVSAEFRRLASRYRFTREEQLENLFVTYNDFSEEARTEANWKASPFVKWSIKWKYPAVWDVMTIFSGSVVFYYSDTDIAANENNGNSKMITDDYYALVKKFDKLGYFTRENIRLKFDSKQNYYDNFKGNYYYYTHG